MVLWLAILNGFASAAQFASVTLAWDSSTDPDVVAYRVYWNTNAADVHANFVEVGAVNTAVVTGLVPGTTYYFVATALDSLGLESSDSNMVSYTVPVVALRLSPPGNLTPFTTGPPLSP